jgi:hypothetical protein
VTWRITKPFSELSPSDIERLLGRYEKLTGIVVHDRHWHRALQSFKLAVIMLVGAMHFDAGHSADLRMAAMGPVVPIITQEGLRELGIEEQLESGSVTARRERIESVRNQQAQSLTLGRRFAITAPKIW